MLGVGMVNSASLSIGSAMLLVEGAFSLREETADVAAAGALPVLKKSNPGDRETEGSSFAVVGSISQWPQVQILASMGQSFRHFGHGKRGLIRLRGGNPVI
jgi:hypothetical protein